MSHEKVQTEALSLKDFIFPCQMWLVSRLLVVIAMMVIAPALPAPPGGISPTPDLHVFAWADSGWYVKIAAEGYEYANDGRQHSIAWFPLMPLLIRVVMSLGLSPLLAGVLINNFAFLAALLLIYHWTKERYSPSTARWTTAALAWCPLSLFCTILYTEGLFLLLSAATLRAFERRQHIWAAFWGMLATATRPTGIALIPAYLITAWRERRPASAYIASIAAGFGLYSYMLYCAWRFGNPLVFVHVQKAFGRTSGFNGPDWLKMLMQIVVGTANWKHGGIKDPWHPLLVVLICACGFALWYFRKKLGAVKTDYGFCTLVLLLWIVAGTPLVNTAMVLGGAYLLWQYRQKLSFVLVTYGFCGIGLIFSSGSADSAERYAYGLVPVVIAFGILLSRHSRWGYPTMAFFAILLINLAIRCAQHLWVG